MTISRLLLSATICIALCLSPAFGEEVAPTVENSKKAAIGEINSNAVQVRSGAGDTYYPTAKLDKGAQVTVIGYKFDWLKIVPPEGSFCVVGKVYVDTVDGKTGKIKGSDVNVRAGSTVNAMRTTVQTKLNEGDSVEIIGEEADFYKIKPPTGVALYVMKQFVDPVKEVPAIADAQPLVPTTGAVVDANGSPQPPVTTPDVIPTTQPITGIAAVPSTQPTQQASAIEADFDKLEIEFADISRKAIEEQPLSDLQAKYEKLTASKELPESMRRVADFRLGTLKVRNEAREQFVAVRKMQEENQKKQLALKAEQEEIQAQIAKNDVSIYAAVGTLRTSSLQQGDGTLYRLTDPGTGRTVVYIRTNDEKINSMIGKFIGVKGEVAADAKLSVKVVTPTSTEMVDQNELFKSVAAQIVPPSMLPKTQIAGPGSD